MGVQGLWQLLETTGRPVTLESLEGKVLAVDVSIWLHQAIHGMRDDQGNVAPNAHLLVLFHRICKLLFYRIKPVFVFDGGVPQLKKQTLVARRQRREMAASKSKRTADKMLKNYMKSHALQAVMGGNKKGKGPSVPKISRISSAQEEPDMFQLPPMPESSSQDSQDDSEHVEDTWEKRADDLADYAPYVEDPDNMDIDSDVFQALPLEIQHELITEMREKGKRTSWKKLKELPKKADDFSNYQITKLLGKGKMSQRLDKLRKEMTVHNTGAIASMLDFEKSIDEVHAGRIMSEDAEHYVLVKNKPKSTDNMDREGALEQPSTSANSQMVAAGENLEDDSGVEVKEQEVKELEVKGQEIKGQEIKVQSTSQASSDMGDISKETPISTDKSEAISNAVKSFFAKSTLQAKELQADSDVAIVEGHGSSLEAKGEASTSVIKHVSSDTNDSDIVIVSDDDDDDDGDVLPSADDVEIIRVKSQPPQKKSLPSQPPKKSLPSFFMSVMDKLVASALKEQREQPEEDNVPSHIPDVDVPSLPAEHSKTLVTKKKSSGEGNVSNTNADRDDEITDKQGVLNEKTRPKDVHVQITDVTSTGTQSHDHQKVDASKCTQPNATNQQNQHVVPMMASLLDRLVASALSSEETGPVGALRKPGGAIVGGPVAEIVDGSDEESIIVEDSDDDFVDVPIDTIIEKSTTTPGTITPEVNISSSSSSSLSGDREESKPTDNEDEVATEETALERDEQDIERNDESESDTAEDDVAMETSDHDDREVHLQDASQEWAGMNVDDTVGLQDELESELNVLTTEKGKQERVAVSITDVMYQESKDLLRLFGLPFIVSPQEAEAQCAYLDITDQTHGTITDDSDVWLFGGRYVYKNFFSKGKDVEFFRNADFDKQLVLNREKLILLAYLLGSDYTEGIQGVGWVTAMEILSEFPGEKLQGLIKFRDWWVKTQDQLIPPVESPLKGKLRKLTIHPGFPNPHVTEAYMKPVIDESQDEFSWGSPDLDLLRDFAAEKLGWNRAKTDEALLPVIKKLNEKRVQSKINQFFPMEHQQPKKIKSKRLQKVLNKLANPNLNTAEEEAAIETNQKKRGHAAAKSIRNNSRSNSQGNASGKTKASAESEHSDSDESDEYKPSTKIAKGVKGQIRSSRRTSKKVLETVDLEKNGDDNEDTEEKNSNRNLSNSYAEVKGQIRSSRRTSNKKVVEEEKMKSLTNLATEESVASLHAKDSQNGDSAKDGGGDSRGGARGSGASSGRGKGRVGAKGKGKLLAKRGRGRAVQQRGRGGDPITFTGPNLSASSSDDSN